MKEYRGYKLDKDPDYFMIVINAIGRGSVHKSLRGYYQTYKDAEQAINQYDKRKGEASG